MSTIFTIFLDTMLLMRQLLIIAILSWKKNQVWNFRFNETRKSSTVFINRLIVLLYNQFSVQLNLKYATHLLKLNTIVNESYWQSFNQNMSKIYSVIKHYEASYSRLVISACIPDKRNKLSKTLYHEIW